MAVEAVAGAAILHAWIGLPLWVLAMGLMAMMTATNLLSVRSPFFPYPTWVVMAGFAAVLVAMAVIGDQRTQLFTSLGSLAVVLLAYTVRRARGPRPEPTTADDADDTGVADSTVKAVADS
ncbi:hypothetical protein [Peterkaempfera bronchialis]|uniref:hypothetical protein n=1 Tax=Peterkaempfera bronchialis TaxID=2126346 RepID=UPI0015898A83|nr:hypothetical protein [Peterkaempfera bronchialis]